jgi:phosphoglycerol transferase MdoB-like AlkP superfamily enzyme
LPQNWLLDDKGDKKQLFLNLGLLAIFSVHLFAASYLFMFLSKTRDSAISRTAKVYASLFAILHVIAENFLFSILFGLTFLGAFYSREEQACFSEFNLPQFPDLSQLLQIVFLWWMTPDFILTLGLILVIFKLSRSLAPFTKWYQPLRFTLAIVALDLLCNMFILGLQVIARHFFN